MLTKEDSNNIVNSWEFLAGKELETMLAFYNVLFEQAPEVRFYFPEDMNLMAEKLQKTIDIVIENAHNLDDLIPELHNLGRFHKKVGIEATHYPVVVKSLLSALKYAMKDHYTDEIGQSWKNVLVFISKNMIAAPAKSENSIVKFFKKAFKKSLS